MPKGIPKNGVNKGWIKKGQKMSSDIRSKMGKSRVGIPRSVETKNKISKSHIGIKHSEETKKKFSKLFTGRKHTPEAKKKIGYANRGKKSHFWKGGITPINQKIRTSREYKIWRQSVFIRDNFICIWCGSKDNIQADHIKPFADYPELRFAIDNGRTLCRECHKKTDTWGWNYWVNNKKQK